MWLILVCIIPVFPVVILVIIVGCFDKTSKKKREIRETSIEYKGIKSLLPNKIERLLRENKRIVKRDINEFMVSYRRMVWAICGYGFFWLIYIAFIVLRIYWIFIGKYSNLETKLQGAIIGSLLMSILVTYWFLLTPVFEFLNFRKLANAGYYIWNLLQKVTDFITKLFETLVKYFIQIIVCYIFLLFYIQILKFIFHSIALEISLWIMLLCLMTYQYPVLYIFSKIVSWMVGKKIKWLTNIVVLNSLRNCTYLCMVIVYAYAIHKGLAETAIAGATGILFLIDTFTKEEKNIRKEINVNKLDIEEK